MHDMKRILIATDGSLSAAEAVTVGVDLAAEQAAAVSFVHVADGASLPAADDAIALVAAAELARETGVDADVVVVSGDATNEIVAYADTIDADLIVVGSRGRNAVKGALLGSVSHGVLHEARRPVLIVRPSARHTQAVSRIPA